MRSVSRTLWSVMRMPIPFVFSGEGRRSGYLQQRADQRLQTVHREGRRRESRQRARDFHAASSPPESAPPFVSRTRPILNSSRRDSALAIASGVRSFLFPEETSGFPYSHLRENRLFLRQVADTGTGGACKSEGPQVRCPRLSRPPSSGWMMPTIM